MTNFKLTARSVGRLCAVLRITVDVLDQDGLRGKEQYVVRQDCSFVLLSF